MNIYPRFEFLYNSQSLFLRGELSNSINVHIYSHVDFYDILSIPNPVEFPIGWRSWPVC